MTLVDDIQAVRARADLTDQEKRAAIYDLKGQAIVGVFTPRVGQTITRGVYTLTLTQAPEYGPGRRLIFRGLEVTKNGLPVALDLPLVLVNPPVKVPDGGVDAQGNPTFRLDVLQAIRDVITDWVR